MAVTSNASTKTQRTLAKKFIATLDDPEFEDATLTFADGRDQTTTLVLGDDEPIVFANYAEFREYIESGTLPGDNGEAAYLDEEEPEEQPEAEAEQDFDSWVDAAKAHLGQLGEEAEEGDEEFFAEAFEQGATPGQAADALAEERVAERTASARKQEDAEAKRRALEEAQTELDTEIRGLIEDIGRERAGELQKNEARFHKGSRLVRFEELAERMKAAGHERFTRTSAIDSFARQAVEASMQAEGVIDPSIKTKLSASESSMVRKVFRTFMHDDMDTTFRLIDTIDPNTGDPIANDAGEPPEMPVTSIALNKLYQLAKFYNPEDHDRIVSFAHRHTERAITRARQLMDAEKDNAAEVIEALEDYLASDPKTPDGEPFASVDDAIADFVARERGEQAPEDVRSIKVATPFYKGTWTTLKQISTALYRRQGWLVDGAEEAPNTQLLERVMSLLDFEQGAEAQVRNVAQLFTLSGDITEEEAAAFVEAFTPEWVGGDEAEEEEAAAA